MFHCKFLVNVVNMAVTKEKRKRVSKKTKESWRKYTKVNDIEEFLHEQREDERLGAPLTVLPNDQLFIVDTEPQNELLSARERRRQKATRPLKGFLALQPHTQVPDPIVKRNRVRSKEERKSKFVKQKEATGLKTKEIQAIADRRLDEIRREQRATKGEITKDLWSSNNIHTIENDPWINVNTKKHNLRNTGNPVKDVRADVHKKKSALPAVELPHPGMSYNPSFNDHQDLLQIVAKQEIKVIKEEKHLERVTKGLFRRITETKKQKEWITEMSQGLDTKKESKSSDNEEDQISANLPVKNKKKTLQQRRKQKEQLELERKRNTLKLEKKKIGDIQKINLIKKSLEHLNKKQEKLRELRKKRAEKKKNEPKVLNALKIDDPGLDFQLGQDISGNLRNIHKEGNLLSERFVSLQKRNILQPTKRIHRKKPKIKRYVKAGHKDDWEVTVARNSSLK